MSEPIATTIHLGVILPKLKATAKDGLSTIVQEHVDLLAQGTLEGEDRASLDEVKGLIMQSLEIFLDNEVLPPIYKQFNPPVEAPAEAAEAVEAA